MKRSLFAKKLFAKLGGLAAAFAIAIAALFVVPSVEPAKSQANWCWNGIFVNGCVGIPWGGYGYPGYGYGYGYRPPPFYGYPGYGYGGGCGCGW